jgi:modulator of FtsH protease
VSYFPSEQTGANAGTEARLASGLLGKVFGLLAFAMAFAVVGGYVGAQLGSAWFLPIMIAYFGLFFAVQALREREGINLIMLYAFAFATGLLIGPVIESYVSAGAGDIVVQAAAITGVMTAGLSAFALTTKRDLSGLAPYLFMALLGLLVAMIVNIFVGGSMLSVIIGWAGAFIFSGLLIVQVQRAKYAPDTMANAVVITLGIFLNIVNLFLSILRILQGGRR